MFMLQAGLQQNHFIGLWWVPLSNVEEWQVCAFSIYYRSLETKRQQKNREHTHLKQQAHELKQIKAHKSMHSNTKMTSLQAEK